jgi:hypothetical protein
MVDPRSSHRPSHDESDRPALLVHAPDVLVRRTSCSAVVLGSQRSPLVLRGTAVAIWDAFERVQSIEDGAAGLAAEYDAPVDVVYRHMTDVVERLLQIDALTSPQSADDVRP